MIKPTVGRIVWYRGSALQSEPWPAIINMTDGDSWVSLTVFPPHALPFPSSLVELVQEDRPRPSNQEYCEWMPYQKGQAKKTESLEEALANPIKLPTADIGGATLAVGGPEAIRDLIMRDACKKLPVYEGKDTLIINCSTLRGIVNQHLGID